MNRKTKIFLIITALDLLFLVRIIIDDSQLPNNSENKFKQLIIFHADSPAVPY